MENNSQLPASSCSPAKYKAEREFSALNSQLSTKKDSQLKETFDDKAATRLNIEKLKLIDDISRLIVELKNKFPELAQDLSKVRDNISANQENIPVKKLLKLLEVIQQNLNAPIDKQQLPALKLAIAEAVKILNPAPEIPQENKLLLALSKNDFISVVSIASQIVTQESTDVRNVPNAPNAPVASPQTFQVVFHALQELKELGIPRELQNAPLKELEAVMLQKTAIEVPKDLAKKLSTVFSEKPVFAIVTPKAESLVITPLIKNAQPEKTENRPSFEIPLPPKTTITLPQKIEIALSLHQPPTINSPIPNTLPAEHFAGESPKASNPQSTTSSKISQPLATSHQPLATSHFLQPWPASVQIPKEERNFWLSTNLPLTPQILSIRDTILSFGNLPENPEIVRTFASTMHELSLQTEHGTNVTKEQANLLWRVISLDHTPPSGHPSLTAQPVFQEGNSQCSTLSAQLLKYQPLGNYEGDLFKNLPEPVRRELLQELPTGKVWQPEALQKAIEKILFKYTEQQVQQNVNFSEQAKTHEEIRNVLQNLKEQIQWTRIDQDTRPQIDKENVFYFMHEGELQKGRLKIKDERKGSSKKRQDSALSFSIETNTKKLGKVHVDLVLSKNILNIRFQDDAGTASDAVKEERETLAKELADIGLSLGELIYGKTPKVHILKVAEKKEKNSLDLRA
jgi:hypothetical protein